MRAEVGVVTEDELVTRGMKIVNRLIEQHALPTSAYWVSWYGTPVTFTWHGPWWISGYRYAERNGEEVEQPTICAAVSAQSEDHARQLIADAHDTPVEIEWRFTQPCPAGWTPFSSRFRRKEWMRWPWPTGAAK